MTAPTACRLRRPGLSSPGRHARSSSTSTAPCWSSSPTPGWSGPPRDSSSCCRRSATPSTGLWPSSPVARSPTSTGCSVPGSPTRPASTAQRSVAPAAPGSTRRTTPCWPTLRTGLRRAERGGRLGGGQGTRLRAALPRCSRGRGASCAASRSSWPRRPAGPSRCSPGSFVQELRPAAYDKGLAVDELMEQPPFAGRRPVVVGDDRTDEYRLRRRQRPRRGVRAGGTTRIRSRSTVDRSGCRAWLALGDSRGGA